MGLIVKYAQGADLGLSANFIEQLHPRPLDSRLASMPRTYPALHANREGDSESALSASRREAREARESLSASRREALSPKAALSHGSGHLDGG